MRKSFVVAFPLVVFVFACSSAETSAPDGTRSPSGAPSGDGNDSPSVADPSIVAEAEANAELQQDLATLHDAGWTGGDAAWAKVLRNDRGEMVSFALAHADPAAAVDLIYGFDDQGARAVLVKPADAASAKVLADTMSDEPPEDTMSAQELASIVPEDADGAVSNATGSAQPAELPGSAPPAGSATEAATTCGTLFPGQTLYRGQSLHACKNGYRLTMQWDGNLVVYGKYSRALWATGTNGKGGYRATMQRDGNFVVYDGHSRALWATGHRHSGDALDLKNDGEVWKDTCGDIHWRSNKYCDTPCLGSGACVSWGCQYTGKLGFTVACFSSDNPTGAYHIQIWRHGHTVPGFCGTGTYADHAGNGVSCPTTHVFSALFCDG